MLLNTSVLNANIVLLGQKPQIRYLVLRYMIKSYIALQRLFLFVGTLGRNGHIISRVDNVFDCT